MLWKAAVMKKSKAITSSVKLFFAGYFVIIAVFLTALKSLLNLVIEDLLSLKPYTLAVVIDSYAMTTSNLVIAGLFCCSACGTSGFCCAKIPTFLNRLRVFCA